MKVAEYIITEDWAGNIVDKIIVTKDKGLFRFSTTNNIKSNGIRTNSSQCIYIEWPLCDYINGMTFNCEFIGTQQPLVVTKDSNLLEKVEEKILAVSL